jgi:hypothetical protein
MHDRIHWWGARRGGGDRSNSGARDVKYNSTSNSLSYQLHTKQVQSIYFLNSFVLFLVYPCPLINLRERVPACKPEQPLPAGCEREASEGYFGCGSAPWKG